MKIPFCDLSYVNNPDALARTFSRVAERGQWILGGEVEQFEREWAAFCGYRFCVGVGNGFDALRLMLDAYGIGQGDDVIVPTNTYIATWLAVSAVGAYVLPVEPDPSSGLLDPNGVESAMATRRVRAVLATHLYGRSCDMGPLTRLCERHGAQLLTDAAQGHGLFEFGDAGAFSFYPTKNLGGLGDGGAVVTNNERVAERIRWLRNYGSSAKDVHIIRGGNSRLDELQAAFLHCKLQSLQVHNEKRAHNAALYESLPLELKRFRPASADVHHLHVVRHPARDAIRDRLAAAGIATMVHYPTPPHLQAAYRQTPWKRGAFPIAERLADESISLPVGPELGPEQIGYVIQAARAALREAA